MAEVKNFGLIGVGTSVQFGKSGSRVKSNEGLLQMRNAADDDFVRVQGDDPTEDDDLVTLRYLENLPGINIDDGMDLPLGVPGDGSFVNGAVALTQADTVTNAIDSINEVLGLLVPPQPPTWPNTALAMTTTSAYLANGAVPDNTGDGLPSAGSVVGALFSTSYATGYAGNTGDSGSGPGTTGTMTAVVNGTTDGSRALTDGDDSGTYGDLNIQSNAAYPSATPGFWRMVRARAVGTVPVGYNKVQLTHSDANNTTVLNWVADTSTSNSPAVASASIVDAGGAVAYSSSVPHYTGGQTLTVSATLNNIAGYVYKRDGAFLVDGTGAVFGNAKVLQSGSHNFGGAGMPANPRPVGDTGQTATVAALTATSAHASGRATVQHVNARASSAVTTINSPIILVMSGTPSTVVDEDNIAAATFSPTTAVRVKPTGDAASATPDATFTSTTTNWDATDALDTFDAAVVAGRLSHDVTNYSSGYVPVGPNLSGRTGTQYITFMLRGIKSKFSITVTGSYASARVKLPGVSDSASYYDGGSSNGWWNMAVAYSGAGVPGNGGDSNASLGCAEGALMGGGSGTFTCTFGPETSANSTNNIILVRFGLTSGQAITQLSFGAA